MTKGAGRQKKNDTQKGSAKRRCEAGYNHEFFVHCPFGLVCFCVQQFERSDFEVLRALNV